MFFGNWNPFKKGTNIAKQPALVTVNKVGDNKNIMTANQLYKQSLI